MTEDKIILKPTMSPWPSPLQSRIKNARKVEIIERRNFGFFNFFKELATLN